MTPAFLVALATFSLVCGGALMAWPVRIDGPPALSEDAAPTLYRRRILGAMIVGASLFLGGFTLAATNPIF